MPSQHPNDVLPRPIDLHQLIQISRRVNNRPLAALTADGFQTQKECHKDVENVPFRIRKMADNNSNGFKLPPVNGSGQLVADDSSKNASKELSRGHGEASFKTRQESSRYQQVVRRRSRPHQSSCSSDTPTIASSAVSSYEKRRSLIGLDNCEVVFPTSVSHQSLRHNSLDKLQLSRSQVRFRRRSDYDIFAAECRSEGGSTKCTLHESFLSSKFEEQPFDRETDTSKPQQVVHVPKCLPLFEDPQPPVADMTFHTLRDMQLRYKNLMQLSKHEQFSNTPVSKERIRKPHTVPGLKSQNNLGSCGAAVNKDLELLAVLSVKHKSRSESCANSITHNSVALRLAKKWNSNVNSESDLLLNSVSRREKIYENRKKLKKKGRNNSKAKKRSCSEGGQ
ncbi:uncharacterized protein LOC135471208 [Liolophura sinensis]|uniref:uncharacterized protein LOC135471208 n=1 Tax=Liolophura sinensis TaxID=3198878 RepID=UPI003158CE4E